MKDLLVLVALSVVWASPGNPLLGAVPASQISPSNTSADPAKVTIGYACVGGHTPGNYRITIQGGEAAIITPGRPPVTSKIPVAEDEVEHFLALLRLGDFFNYPTSPPPTGQIIIDGPTETVTLTVDGKTHTADCTETQDPYLRDLVGLFREILQKQETILTLEAAVTAKTRPSQPMTRFLRWNMPLRGQRDKANGLVKELLERYPLPDILACDASGKIETPGTAPNSGMIDILAAKLKAQGSDIFAVDALGSSGDPRATAPLLNLLAEGNRDRRTILALARLDCRAVLDEALKQRNIEALGYIGRDDPRAVAMVQGEAYGWFTERWPRSVAIEALARMRCLPTPTKANLFAHVFAAMLVLLGVVVLIAPRAPARLSDRVRGLWLRVAGLGGVLAGAGLLYMLHFAIFF